MANCTTGGDFKCTYDGLMLPIFGKDEMEWNNIFRLFLYLMGLGWTFLGIAIISDVFMSGIEKVTSWKRRVKDKTTGKHVTVYVWNDTVANLTLMALGSSAPEILLSLIEITTQDMFLGELGAGTIVGSAAFNLLCISAVCVMAIPDGEVRYIKQTTVYMITASASVLAYLWLMFILQATTPNVCSVAEGVSTLLFCPLLVFVAFLADKGYFDRSGGEETEKAETGHAIPDDVTPEELAQIEQQIRDQHPGVEMTSEQIVEIMVAKYFTHRSRAYYRQLATKKAIGGKRFSQLATAPVPPPEAAGADKGAPKNSSDSTTVTAVTDTYDEVADEKQLRSVKIGFASARFAFLENCGQAQVSVVRSGSTHLKASVQYQTIEGTAKAGSEYKPIQGVLTFGSEETSKTLLIDIFDDDEYEENQEFYIELSDPKIEEEAKGQATLSDISTTCVVIIDDDEPGVIRFKEEEVNVEEGEQVVYAEVAVECVNGAAGTIECSYATEDMSAIGSMDYTETSGRIELGPSVQSTTISIPILATGRFQKNSSFILRLKDPKNCTFDKETDGGDECCICHVHITGRADPGRAGILSKMGSKIQSQQAILGHRRWRQQFYDALFTVVEDDGEEDGEEAPPPTPFDYVMHIVSLPWKFLFAFVPPVDYCGGWLCFFGALLMIAVVTAIVGDMANLVGCCLDIPGEITAITFVALGTSLPDTFASKTAAAMDPYADASIGNITGSNSVNVFIGLGLSWSLAAIYWELSDPTDEWLAKVEKKGGVYYDVRDDVNAARSGGKAVFVAPAGTLGFNLAVFSGNAFFAIQHLFARRKKFGGELGGPRRGFMGQYMSAGWLVFQWVVYVAASSVMAVISKDDDCEGS